nr:40S ribosomal protein S5-like [Tanacetum cinerariifolium]
MDNTKCYALRLNAYSSEDYITAIAIYMPHTAGRFQAKRFRKAQCQIVERLTNSLMMYGRNNGKKLMVVRIVKDAMEIIHLLTDANPIQIIVDAVINNGAREDATRIGSAGAVRCQAVDISPLRRVNQAIYLLTILVILKSEYLNWGLTELEFYSHDEEEDETSFRVLFRSFTSIRQLLFVPLGYTFGSKMFEIDEARGASTYGAGTYPIDRTRNSTKLKLKQAFYQGHKHRNKYRWGLLMISEDNGEETPLQLICS